MYTNNHFKTKLVVAGVIALVITNANASISSINQYKSSSLIESTIKVQEATNDPVILNPAIDEIKASDPRIKAVIEYAKQNKLSIAVVFFNIDNLRYVKQVNALFDANHIVTNSPQLAKTPNISDINLVKIYVVKDKANVNESN